MASPLDKTLKEKYKRNSLEVRKGDEVKVMRGKFKKRTGKVIACDVRHTRVQIDGLNRSKKAGDKVPVWFHPSKIKIISIDDKDIRRVNKKKVKTENKNVAEKKEEKKIESKKMEGKEMNPREKTEKIKAEKKNE